MRNDFRQRQVQYLEQIAAAEISRVDMSEDEKRAKESFRIDLEKVCREVCQTNPILPTISLQCFGSFQSGFASAGSDMDLVIVLEDPTATATCFSLLEQDLPRTLEKKLLESGFGARLLTRTRVPIIKVCQSPASDFLDKLREEREKWDVLPVEKKYPHLHTEEQAIEPEAVAANGAHPRGGDSSAEASKTSESGVITTGTNGTSDVATDDTLAAPTVTQDSGSITNEQQIAKSKRDQSKTWTRERKPGPLDFPHEGVGIQCDINFFNPLGLHNTQMLRCYSMCDPRVRPMVLFVKSWVKQRKINSSYSGTLSSYGYVLMVLHYLMNVVQPPVLPNLQMPWRPQGCTPSSVTKTEVDGWTVDFWRNEDEIKKAVSNGQMSSNRDSLGSLLAGFFQYYSSMGQGPQFRWTQQVLSLRTERGILTKEAKGWVKATTEEGEGKKIQHRYLYCIEDPFELTHNVARTVTHNGIVAIRDEFRRAYRILNSVGNGYSSHEGPLFAQLVEEHPEPAEQTATEAAQTALKSTSTNIANGSAAPESLSKSSHAAHGAAPSPALSLPSHSRSTSLNAKSDLDISSSSSFPSLGSASITSGGKKKKIGPVGNFAAIEGNAAQAYLDEYRRKKAEEQAGVTAMGAAEAVLGDD
jgi:terminal uridylyltransferase